MPYIVPQKRKQFDELIDALAGKIVEESKVYKDEGAFAGILNYVCTRLVLKIIRMRFGKIRYWIIAIVSGTFKNIADEFYRRIGTPYEEKQIKESGDVDLYQEYRNEIEEL